MTKVINNKVMKKRLMTKIDCSKPLKTDQSFKKSCDINNIMKQYSRTGVLPSTREHLARYIDNTQVLSLEESYEQIAYAQNLFMELPADIRKLMDNDPSKMVDVLKNPDHKELLVKRGVLTDNSNKASQGNKKEQEVQSPKSQNEPKGE